MGDKWIGWIYAIVKSTRMSVLTNGSLTQEFTTSRGLRQKDPLAPYLFLIIDEILSKLIIKAKEKGIFEGIKFFFTQDSVTRYRYAHDTILFVENKV